MNAKCTKRDDVQHMEAFARPAKELRSIWLFAASDHTGTICDHVAVEAVDEAEVGRFVKANSEKFADLFEYMEYCGYMGGDVYEALYPEKGAQYPNLDVKQALATIPDDKLVSEFWAYEKDCESTAVNAFRLNTGEIIKLGV